MLSTYLLTNCLHMFVMYVSCFKLLELKALCELVGAYGIRHIGDECIDLIVSQVNEIKVMSTVRHVIITSRKFNDCPKFIG